MSSSDSVSEEIEACPSCDSATITKHTGGMHRPVEPDSRFRCRDCGTQFDEPVVRERRHPGPNPGNLSAGGRALLEADPDDFDPSLVTDGGRRKTHFFGYDQHERSVLDVVDEEEWQEQLEWALTESLAYAGLVADVKSPVGAAHFACQPVIDHFEAMLNDLLHEPLNSCTASKKTQETEQTTLLTDGGRDQVMYQVDVYESGADDLGSIVVPEVPVVDDKIRTSDGTIYRVVSRTWLLAATVSYDSVASITVEPVGVDKEVADV